MLESVVSQDLCTGCGACSLVCPKGAISFDRDKVVPIMSLDPEVCAGCTACSDVCPGLDTGTDESERRLFGRTRSEDERWLGVFDRYAGMASTDAEIHERSASGGATTTLLLSSARTLGATLFLTMGRDPEEGWRAAPSLTDDPAVVVGNCQSTYQLAPYLGALRAAFDTRPDDRVAVVGLACHMQALRKLQRHDSDIGRWARDKIVLLIETACSSNTLPNGTRQILVNVLEKDVRDIKSVKFREGPYPGNFKAVDESDNGHVVPFWQILGDLKQNKTFRCLSCGDWMSGLADISVCDGDPNIFDTSVNLKAIRKHGRVIVRTATGESIVGECVRSGLVETWPIEFLGFNLGLERKMNRRRHYELSGRKISGGSSAPDRFDAGQLVSDDELIDPRKYKQ